MSEFKWRHFSGEIILQCVRWYCKYGISYRDLEEMMADLEWDELERALESIRHESLPTPPLSL
jgi:transposase-like protein